MPPEERLEQRKRNVAPLVDAFFAYLKYEQGHVAPKMKTGRQSATASIRNRFCGYFLQMVLSDDKQCCGAKYSPLYSGQEELVSD